MQEIHNLKSFSGKKPKRNLIDEELSNIDKSWNQIGQHNSKTLSSINVIHWSSQTKIGYQDPIFLNYEESDNTPASQKWIKRPPQLDDFEMSNEKEVETEIIKENWKQKILKDSIEVAALVKNLPIETVKVSLEGKQFSSKLKEVDGMIVEELKR